MYYLCPRLQDETENPIQDAVAEASEAVAVVVGGYGSVGGGASSQIDEGVHDAL